MTVREIVAVIVAADSPAGRAAEAINDLSAHLPDPAKPRTCPMCSAPHSWPCVGFDAAAHRVMEAGLRLVELVPLDLHPRLWPPKHPPSPQPRPAAQTDDESKWFAGQEQPDG